jgi:catechol 2,3-dioxygenase-like lactoylglutathione lyase family enzyme
MSIKSMNHFTVMTNDLDKTVKFYGEILGLKPGYRPLEDAGAWLYAGGKDAVLHVVADRPLPKEAGGVLDHMAFTGADLCGLVDKLRAREVKFELYRQINSNILQIFFLDPNSAKVELDFAADEPLPTGFEKLKVMGEQRGPQTKPVGIGRDA